MFAYIMVFTCTWWIVFFMVLPFAIKRDKKPETGNDIGAPIKAHLGVKIIITSVIAAILSKIFISLINEGFLSRLADSYVKFLSHYIN